MNSKGSFDVEFQPIGKRVPVSPGGSLLEAARQSGIELATACGGEGSCGQCQVIILAGETSEPSLTEKFLLTETDLEKGRRLACQVKPLSNLKVEIPPASLISEPRLQVESNLKEIKVDQLVRALDLEMESPSMEDLRSDLKRVLESLNLPDLHADIAVIRSIPPLLRANDWRATAFVNENELIGLAAPGLKPLGFAVDLGTTKIAAYLLDLETGKDIESTGIANPQISYGEDVISRLNFVHRNPDGGRIMAELVRSVLDKILEDMLTRAGAVREQVVDACIVGNTAITHLLLELPVSQLAKAPYVSAMNHPVTIPAAELGLKTAPGAKVYIPPGIGGFVGADHVAMILGSELDRSDKVSLGLDIGTNTEIALRVPGKDFMTSVSCASGPAFEGAHISEGMRAASGAIEKLRITSKGIELTTINNEAPIGLCGSGIIDLAAELHRSGLINHRGRFQKDRENVRVNGKGGEFQLVPPSLSGTSREIVVSQEDINEIQLAKGAINAGLEILLAVTGTKAEDVEEVIVAGAFGSFLNIENAIAMGLFPHLPNAVYRQVGNAAAIGAKKLLLSGTSRHRAVQIEKHTRYNELTAYPGFNRVFALGMLFPKIDTPGE